MHTKDSLKIYVNLVVQDTLLHEVFQMYLFSEAHLAFPYQISRKLVSFFLSYYRSFKGI